MEKLKKFWALILRGLKYFWKECIKYPLSLMAHPIDGFYEFKRYKKGKMGVAIFYIIFYAIVKLIEYNGNGFIINSNDPNKFNAFKIIALVIFPILILVVANWTITVLFNGKGTMKDIFTLAGYCLMPVVYLCLFNVIFSNFMTLDEVSFYSAINIIAYALLAYNIFFGIMGIHEYSFGATILTILGTILSTIIILFVGMLVLTLLQTVYQFIYSIYREIAIRYF